MPAARRPSKSSDPGYGENVQTEASCTPIRAMRSRKRIVSRRSATDSSGKPIRMFALTFSPARTAVRIDASSRSSFTFFLIACRVRGEPLSGAYETLRQPLRYMARSVSSSSASERVPLGSCQVMRSCRASSSWQNSRIHSRSTIAVRS